MHKVEINAESYVKPETAFEAAKELEEAFDKWQKKWSILPRAVRSYVQVAQELF